MQNELITRVAQTWDEKTCDIMSLREVTTLEMEELLKKIFDILYKYHTAKNVPKEVCQLLVNVEEYMYFLDMIGGNEEKLAKTSDMYRPLYCIIDAMKKASSRVNTE